MALDLESLIQLQAAQEGDGLDFAAPSILGPGMRTGIAGPAAAASILGQLSGPSRTPVSFGSILGQTAGAYAQADQKERQIAEQMAIRKSVAEANRAKVMEGIAEKRRAAAASQNFQKMLSESDDPTNPANMLEAGLKSGAFDQKTTIDFTWKVMERQAERERKAEEFKAKLADQQLAREDRLRLERDLANLRGQIQKDNITLRSALDRQVKPVTVMGDGGKAVVKDAITGRVIGDAPPTAGQQKAAEAEAQKGNAADVAEGLVDRLDKYLKDNPRSTTGLGSGVVRGFEAVANTAVPGLVGSQATEALQTKEALISALSSIKKEGLGRMSNQDVQRIDRAIGLINTGTPDAMNQGLNDVRDTLDIMRGKPARSLGTTTPTPGGKPKKFEEGKTYVDKNGNRAVYRNGKFEEVK